MFNRTNSIKISEFNLIKELVPDATITQAIRLKEISDMGEIQECVEALPKLKAGDITAVISCRRFVRWYDKNGKVISVLLGLAPAFGMIMHGFTASTAIVAFGTPAGSTVHAFPSAVASIALKEGAKEGAKAVATEGGFFSGHGKILLHMLIVGFVTLVVSSFLKFTGRGDLIPLIAFVGCSVILLEVLRLFGDIYTAIKTFINM